MLNPFNPYGDLPEIPTSDDLTPEEQAELHVKGCMFAGCGWVVAVAVGLLLCALLGSCTTTRTATTDTDHRHTTERDTLYIVQTQRDSTYRADSIRIVERWHGDTLLLTTERFTTRYRDRWHTDTLRIYRVLTDTITQTRTETVTRDVPRTLTPWQRFRLSLANVVLIALALTAALYIIRKKLKI